MESLSNRRIVPSISGLPKAAKSLGHLITPLLAASHGRERMIRAHPHESRMPRLLPTLKAATEARVQRPRAPQAPPAACAARSALALAPRAQSGAGHRLASRHLALNQVAP